MTSFDSSSELSLPQTVEQVKVLAMEILEEIQSLIKQSPVLVATAPTISQYVNPFGVGEMEPEQWLLHFFIAPVYQGLATNNFVLVKQAHNISPYFEQAYQSKTTHPDYQHLINLLVSFEQQVKQL